MVICPWCGTAYLEFQSNCKNCGGLLTPPEERLAPSNSAGEVPVPPPAPRPVSDRYIWRLLWMDGWAVVAFVFALLGLIFTLLGAALTIGIVTAFVGLPFLGFGLLSLAGGAALFAWRYREKQNIINVLRLGQPVQGRILEVSQNFSVRINHIHPWIIRYQFPVGGQQLEGQLSTLNTPGGELRAGSPACILFLPSAPQCSVIYPHP